MISLIETIERDILPGQAIPKPAAKTDFLVKDWGKRRGEAALIYLIPNHKNPQKPSQKGISVSEFENAFIEIRSSGKLTRAWFNANLVSCAKEGGCNFTTIGGIFILLGIARYISRGEYEYLR